MPSNSLLEREGEPHDRLRALVAGVFQREHTARREPGVRALADRLVAELAAKVHDTGEADVIACPSHEGTHQPLLDQPARERSSGPSLTGACVVRPAQSVLRPPPTPFRLTVPPRLSTGYRTSRSVDTRSSANNLTHVLRLQGEYAGARRSMTDVVKRFSPRTIHTHDSERAHELDERMGRSEPSDQ
jgi:hypothetical protein